MSLCDLQKKSLVFVLKNNFVGDIMSRFFKSRFFIGLAIFTLVVFIFMMLSTIDRDKSSFVGNAFGVVITPVQKVFWNIGDGVGNFFANMKDMASYKEKYQNAEKEIKRLEEDTRRIQKLETENKRLRDMLDLKSENPQYRYIGASVIAKDSGNWYSTFTVDKGTSSGVSKNDVVVTADGVVGHIYEVGATWGKVMSIIDSKSSVGAIIERTNDRGMVEGDLQFMGEGLCKMSYIAKGATLIKGDYVETSGLGGIYPGGLLLGKIKSVSEDSQGLYNDAVIETAVDFARIKEVMIIKQKGE